MVAAWAALDGAPLACAAAEDEGASDDELGHPRSAHGATNNATQIDRCIRNSSAAWGFGWPMSPHAIELDAIAQGAKSARICYFPTLA